MRVTASIPGLGEAVASLLHAHEGLVDGITRLHTSIGALVSGVDLHNPIAAGDAETLRAALNEFHLLLFRQGPVEAENQIDLMHAFGA